MSRSCVKSGDEGNKHRYGKVSVRQEANTELPQLMSHKSTVMNSDKAAGGWDPAGQGFDTCVPRTQEKVEGEK